MREELNHVSHVTESATESLYRRKVRLQQDHVEWLNTAEPGWRPHYRHPGASQLLLGLKTSCTYLITPNLKNQTADLQTTDDCKPIIPTLSHFIFRPLPLHSDHSGTSVRH